MSLIRVISIFVSEKVVKVRFDVSADLEKYFSTVREFEVEYSEDISNVPQSVLIIPFVCDVLPIAWVTNAILEVPQLDREFYDSIPKIRQGYVDMSPMLIFKGGIRVGEIIDNHYESTEKTAAFFSGGVDAFATLIAHANERPQLITLWGADVKLDDVKGWGRVKQHVLNTSVDFDLPSPLFVRSNFRLIVNEITLGELVCASGAGWWYGFQHGIAIISHAAPIAYLKRWKMVYIASSNTIEAWDDICASDPRIDNNVRLVSTEVWHDQYDYTRQQKMQHIITFCRETGKQIALRVCWMSAGGGNCGHCEKCVRTIYNVLAEGEDPNDYGFSNWRHYASMHSKVVRRTLATTHHVLLEWCDIQDRFHETNVFRKVRHINWIYSLDVKNPLTFLMRIKLYWKCIRKKIKRKHVSS